MMVSAVGCAAAQALLAQPAQNPGAAAAPAGTVSAGAAPAGVENAQRAWQNWTLNCQGCHRFDGSGSDATAPGIAGTVAKFLL
ncbi:MAG TPA: hypothetical protein VK800_00890, partial [Steroidobacteraceae bacterium]|nr:hypothetical protein [Steroidobacteraceae bacterium]